MSFFIEYIKCEIYQVVHIGKNPQRCFFQQQRMIMLLSRMQMSASTVSALADRLQNSFKNTRIMGETFFFMDFKCYNKIYLSRFTVLHLTFGFDIEIVKLNRQHSYTKTVAL